MNGSIGQSGVHIAQFVRKCTEIAVEIVLEIAVEIAVEISEFQPSFKEGHAADVGSACEGGNCNEVGGDPILGGGHLFCHGSIRAWK